MGHYPGEVHFLPKSNRPGGDAVDRRHVLLANCDDESSLIATFAFASRQTTEAELGAAHVLVNPAASSYRRTGFSDPTYVYPSRIVATGPENLTEDYEGRIIDEMPFIRERLAQALGLGTGTSLGAGSAAGSWRGRVLWVTPDLEEEIYTPVVLVVSEPRYSLARSYQNVVPILARSDYEPGDLDVDIENTPWLSAVQKKLEDAFLYPEGVFALFHNEETFKESSLCIDEATMARLDEALKIYFEL